MNQEKFGMVIKEIRKKHNLTQKQLADKYNVTYQAVSKWENGINMPEISLIKQISKDFNISLDELFDGEFKKKQNKEIILILFIILFLISIIFIVLLFKPKETDFQFKTLSSNCENFNISGNIAYNDNKAAIYITNIKYCGGDDNTKYKEIECVLYETNNEIERKISSYKYNKQEDITLEDFLKEVTLAVDNYTKICKEYENNSLYLSINATNKEGKVITYKIPLALDEKCLIK